MSGFGVFDLFVGAFQLIVPSYALRLVRRFGSHRVGWFVVAAFLTLALLYLLAPLRSAGTGASGMTPQFIYLFASGLLLIGMGHLESLFTARFQARQSEQKLRAKWEAYVAERTDDLSRANEELLREIARREETEIILKESADQYRSLFTESPQPMWIFDLRSLRFIAVNEAALNLYGFTAQQFMALTASKLILPSEVAAFLQEVAMPCPSADTWASRRHLRGDCTIIEVETTSHDLRYAGCPARLVLVSEVGLRRRHERRLCQEQKMAVTRQIAGGVAHHFNNLLTIIDGHTNLLLLARQDSKTGEQLKQISSAANRAAGITRQLLAFSGQFPMCQESLDLNAFLRGLDQTLRRLAGEGLRFQTTYGSHVSQIMADPRRLEHAVVNLVLNARDAMPRGGTLEIATSGVRIDEPHALLNEDARPGGFVRLTVRDTGVGMTPQVQAHLFEPFFTTHDVGQGLGLGLATVYGAVKQHGGWIEVRSEPGAGTEFKLFFPCAP